MMKKNSMKKITALLLAAIMVMAMAISTFAASITINDPKDKAPDNYEIYQVFKGDLDVVGTAKTLVNIEWGTGVTPVDGKITVKEVAYDAKAAAKALADGTFTADEFASAVAEYLSDTKVAATKNVAATDLAPGYYFVKNSGTPAAGQAYTKYILQVLDDVSINVKADAPDVVKKVKNKSDLIAAYRDANNVGIGDTVNYQITSKVPDMDKYTKYIFMATDRLSAGLTYTTDSLVVKIGDRTLEEGKDYDLNISAYSEETGETGTKIEVVFKNFIQYKNLKGTDIVITYDAVLNDDAIVGADGNPNSVELTYSNNPNVTPDGDYPDDDDVVGKTPKDWTITYTTKLGIFKFDEVSGKALSGAKFTLKGTKRNNKTTYTEKYVAAEDGTWYKLKDGTYTETAPSALTEDKYESTETLYKIVVEAADNSTVENVDMTLTSNDKGYVNFGSLAAGEYDITEIQAPNGYNLLEKPIHIVIEFDSDNMTVEDGTEKASWKATQDGTILNINDNEAIDVTYLVNIANNQGSVLPSTGGMGTTIFYTLGAALVLFAGVLLVSKRRMAA